MTRSRRWLMSVAAVVCGSLLALAEARAGEKLLPPDPSAPPVRVLLIVLTDSGKLGRQVALLDQASRISGLLTARAQSG